MGLGALLAGVGGREVRALPPGALLTHPAGSGHATWALPDGEAVDTDAALRLPAVWACVRLLADSVSTLPVDVFAGARSVRTPRLLVEPAAGQPLHEWLYAVVTSLLLRGNAYGLITARSGAALWPAQVELVHPDLVGVTAHPTTGVPTYRIGGRAYGSDEVWHVRAHVLPGVLLGMSPVEYARQSIGLGLGAERFGASFFGSGAVPSLLIKSMNPDLDQHEADAVKAAVITSQRTRTPMVLNPSTEITPISLRPDEAQFVETQRLNVAQIARVFGVPVEMIGGDAGGSLTYSNTEARALDFVRYCLSPWLVRVETALGRLLPRGQHAKFNPDALLRGTTSERYTAHEAALRAGWLTVDEVRALEDLPPLPRPAAAPADVDDQAAEVVA
ncbi:phage portal protein [Pseudonocardia sp. MH-G8]|uniref:phage portal protein n=1 Tax=Pseudonocardia sp. MH-G8 TaxID=1854588 RepID=UPI0013043917|nr:phage portal protein [Pseudonocardia sp. MH-G8]